MPGRPAPGASGRRAHGPPGRTGAGAPVPTAAAACLPGRTPPLSVGGRLPAPRRDGRGGQAGDGLPLLGNAAIDRTRPARMRGRPRPIAGGLPGSGRPRSPRRRTRQRAPAREDADQDTRVRLPRRPAPGSGRHQGSRWSTPFAPPRSPAHALIGRDGERPGRDCAAVRPGGPRGHAGGPTHERADRALPAAKPGMIRVAAVGPRHRPARRGRRRAVLPYLSDAA